MSDNSDIKKKVLEALEKCLGVVTDACKMANISRQTFYRWTHEDNEFKRT
jgi:transcriptional regulator of acetoin/glycerol metabolism